MPTPEKPLENIRIRSRNRSVALSVKEIRQAAGSRRRSEDPVGKVSSARIQLLFSTNDSSSSASKRTCGNKSAEKEQLLEKYEILGKFFVSLDSSIVLSKNERNYDYRTEERNAMAKRIGEMEIAPKRIVLLR